MSPCVHVHSWVSPMALAAGFQCPYADRCLPRHLSPEELKVTFPTSLLNGLFPNPPVIPAVHRHLRKTPSLLSGPNLRLAVFFFSSGLHPFCRPSYQQLVGVRWCLVFWWMALPHRALSVVACVLTIKWCLGLNLCPFVLYVTKYNALIPRKQTQQNLPQLPFIFPEILTDRSWCKWHLNSIGYDSNKQDE